MRQMFSNYNAYMKVKIKHKIKVAINNEEPKKEYKLNLSLLEKCTKNNCVCININKLKYIKYIFIINKIEK